jgi:hypothetical protein
LFVAIDLPGFLKTAITLASFQNDGKQFFLRDKLNSLQSGLHEHDTLYKFEDQEKAQLLNDCFHSIASLDNDNKDIPYMTDRGPGILPIHFYVFCLEVRTRFAY